MAGSPFWVCVPSKQQKRMGKAASEQPMLECLMLPQLSLTWIAGNYSSPLAAAD